MPKHKPPPRPRPAPRPKPRPAPKPKRASPPRPAKLRARPVAPEHHPERKPARPAERPRKPPAAKRRPEPKPKPRRPGKRPHKPVHKPVRRPVARTAGPVAPGIWVTVGATWYQRSNRDGACGTLNDGRLHFAELGTATNRGDATGRGWLARALGRPGELPCGFGLRIRYNGRQTYATKADNGYGQGGNGITSDPAYAMDLYYNLANYLHFDGKDDIQIMVPVPAGHGPHPRPPVPSPPPPNLQQYWHPLAFATANPRRVDQGCDFNYCKGYLVAIADGQIKHWFPDAWKPYGGFLVYEITEPGALQGVWVYYAESVTPVVREGENVRGGSRIAKLTYNESPGIEIGYAEPGGSARSWAYAHGGWNNALDNEDAATASGVAFNQLLAALGGPSSIIKGPIVGERPPWASLAVEAVKRNHAGIPSPVASTLTNPSTDTAIVREDSYAGTITAVWAALDSAYHDAWVIARDTHNQLSKVKFIGG